MSVIIFPQKQFQCLVLPLKHHMERLREIERYMQARREAAVAHLPSIYRSFGHGSSFAVKYFEESRDLQATLAKIERDAGNKRAQKIQELENAKIKYTNLMNQYHNRSCKSSSRTANIGLRYRKRFVPRNDSFAS